MWQYTHYDEIYHHGIKGQKWGRRRFQNKDGSLTPAGQKRYYDDNPSEPKKSKHRTMLEEKYKSKGLTQEEAEKAANDRIRTEKILAITAGVTVAACATYVVTKKIKERTDGLIKAGDVLQRVEMQNTNGKLHDVFYTSKGKYDNTRYKNLLGMTRAKQTGEAYLMNLEANKDIKVASRDKAAKLFGELYKSDNDFRESVKDHVSKHFGGSNKVNINDLSDKNIKKMYENFNANLINIRQSGSGADQTFYSRMKYAGYGAIQDINDMKYSGYRAKNPLIVFGNSDNVMVKSVSKLDNTKIVKDGMKELAKVKAEAKFMNDLDVYGALTAAGATGTLATQLISDNVGKQPTTKK